MMRAVIVNSSLAYYRPKNRLGMPGLSSGFYIFWGGAVFRFSSNRSSKDMVPPLWMVCGPDQGHMLHPRLEELLTS
jgi:hypothetical protein